MFFLQQKLQTSINTCVADSITRYYFKIKKSQTDTIKCLWSACLYSIWITKGLWLREGQ